MILFRLKEFFCPKQDSSKGKFKRNDDLIYKKLFEYIPPMFMTNLSTMLLVTADGLVVGNLVGQDALSSINIFHPATLIISVVSTMLSYGVSTTLSIYMGQHDYEKLENIKCTTKFLLVAAAIFVSIVQIPIITIILSLYNLDKEVHLMALQYGIGIMILNPFSVVASVGLHQLQILGKVKVVMVLSIVESLLNLALDFILIGSFNMGVAGAGYATAIAGITRCIAAIIYFKTKTDVFKSGNGKVRFEEIKEIIQTGVPEGIDHIILSIQSIVMMKVVLSAFGHFGGAIKGVCSFCHGIVNMLSIGIISSMRPMIGFFEGAKDVFSTKSVMRIGTRLMVAIALLYTVIVEINPAFFYIVHGVKNLEPNVKADALLALRIYAIYFIFAAVTPILRLYLINKRDAKYLSCITIVTQLLLPVFAYALYKMFTPPFIMLSYSIVSAIFVALLLGRYYYFRKVNLLRDLDYSEEEIAKIIKNRNTDYKELKNSIVDKVLYLSVKPEDAIEASAFIKKYAMEKNLSEIVANKMALCMEEMLVYAVKSQNKKDISTQIVIRFRKDSGVFMMFDDGENINLNEDEKYRELTIDNYTLLKKIAKSYDYQYILNMNHTTFYL